MRVLLPVALVMAWAGAARAQDECTSDEECVELYADGFECVAGTLGRYCAEHGCERDEDCTDDYGEDAWCEDWGAESRCRAPEPPAYVPPFRSMCSVAGAGRDGPAELLVLLGLAAALLARRRR